MPDRGKVDGALAGIHVLVVDDDWDSRGILQAVLEYAGALVTTARSAGEALGILRRVLADVLVVDIMMPEGDGYWLLTEIRRLEPHHGGTIPAIAITAYYPMQNFQRARDVGYQAYLQKPLDHEALISTIASLAR